MWVRSRRGAPLPRRIRGPAEPGEKHIRVDGEGLDEADDGKSTGNRNAERGIIEYEFEEAPAGRDHTLELRPVGYGDDLPGLSSAYSTSTIISTSTGMLNGNTAMPTAERACFPRSPNTSTMRSEKPLMTLG